jgi:AraC-like DNA-binding protein
MEYFDTRVEFGADEDALVFTREEMDHTPLLANAALNDFLRSAADQLLDPIRLPAFTDRVSEEIRRVLPSGPPNMNDVASALGTTRRTLHRKLAAEGTTFRALVEQIRKDEASLRLAQASDASLTSLALDLGFADLSTFSRAHRRWFGMAPSRARGR